MANVLKKKTIRYFGKQSNARENAKTNAFSCDAGRFPETGDGGHWIDRVIRDSFVVTESCRFVEDIRVIVYKHASQNWHFVCRKKFCQSTKKRVRTNRQMSNETYASYELLHEIDTELFESILHLVVLVFHLCFCLKRFDWVSGQKKIRYRQNRDQDDRVRHQLMLIGKQQHSSKTDR